MTDLHTHILPGMDDGAGDVRQSLVMLTQQAEQGVKTVALTPHYYPHKESPTSFLERREAAWQQLNARITDSALPKLRLGAEVAYVPGMWEWEELPRLCYDGTKVLLIELPLSAWNDDMFQELYRILSRRGITPMVAHLDRYLQIQEKKLLYRLLDMDIPFQVSVSSLLKPFSHRARQLWFQGGVPVSDCHDPFRRAPNLGQLRELICRKYGAEAERTFVAQTDIWEEM